MKNLLYTLFLLLAVSKLCAQTPDNTWWKFDSSEKNHADTSRLNLRYLNERFAGEHGFIKLSKDGNSFVDAKGKPVRFWAVNGGSLAQQFNDKQLDSLARFLAKMGVNIIRYHGAINPKGKNTKITGVDTVEVRNIWRCIAAMKKYGIYTVISPFWPSNGHMGGWIPAGWGIDGYQGKDDLWGVLFFNPRLQQAYRAWMKYLYDTPNPYTTVALKDEPAVAFIQIENEDSPLFWTMSNVKPELKKMVGAQFGKWLKKKYGEADGVKDTMDLIPIYDFTQPVTARSNPRLHDQLQFYVETLKGFYDGLVNYLRNDIGCKQLTNANNWRTASQSRMLDLERWANSGAEVIAVNRYFDPQHAGPNSGWRVDPGDFYGSPSALKNPADLPVNIKQVGGHATAVTESGWNLPNRYQTEGPLLVAAYGGLAGIDAFFWFNQSAIDYMQNPYFTFLDISGQHPLQRWSISTPGQIGMFPANALIHRLGYVKEANILQEQRTLKSMLNRDVPPIFEEQAFDPNRDFVTRNNPDQGMFSPLTYLTGRVSTTYHTKIDTASLTTDLSRIIDAKTGNVSSVTGEQRLNYKTGIFILNTSKAKAVSGFLKGSTTFNLGDVSINSDNEYATIEVVSMDGQDIGRSEKILLQIGSIFRPTGWAEEPATIIDRNKKELTGMKITNTGRMPWLGMPASGSVTIKNKSLRKATQLDAAGYAIKELDLMRTANGVDIKLPTNALYILLER